MDHWWLLSCKNLFLLPKLGFWSKRPTPFPAGSDHYFRMWCRSVPTFQNLAKRNNFQVKIVITTGGTVDHWWHSCLILYLNCFHKLNFNMPSSGVARYIVIHLAKRYWSEEPSKINYWLARPSKHGWSWFLMIVSVRPRTQNNLMTPPVCRAWWVTLSLLGLFDQLGQPKVTAGRDHCFCTCCPSVHPSA